MLNSKTKIKTLQQNYTFKDKIGKGSFGEVQKWTSKTQGKVYAVKFIEVNRLYMDTVAEEANNMEITKQSEYVLDLLDHFYDDSSASYVLITPYYKMGSFEQLIKNNWSLDQALLFFYQIAKALQELQIKEICHLDLKPDNILIKASGEYILCDLGCSRKLEKNNMSYNMLKISTNSKGGGTTEYASPELILQSQMTTSTDVWSLGIILYKMIYKKHPLMKNLGSYHKIIEEFQNGVIHIEYQMHHELQPLVNIVKKMLKPVGQKIGKRLKWIEVVSQIKKLLGFPEENKIDIITNIDYLQTFCDDCTIIVSALLNFIGLNLEYLENQGLNVQNLIKQSCVYLLTLTKEISLLLKHEGEEFGSFYIFETTRRNLTKKQKNYDSYLLKQAEIQAFEFHITLEYGSLAISYQSFLRECSKFYNNIKKLKPERLPIMNRWHKINEIINFIFFENRLEFRKRKQLRQYCEILIYS